MGMDEAQSIGKVKEIEHMRRSENKDIAKMKHHKRNKEKKKNKVVVDTEVVAKESNGVSGEDGNEDFTGNAEWKKKKRENKNKIEGNESKNHKDAESKKVREREDGKEVRAHRENTKANVTEMVKRKKRKREKKRSRDEDEKPFETFNEAHSEDFAEKTEKKKKKKKKKRAREENNEADFVDNNGNGVENVDKEKKKKNKLVDNDLISPTPNKSNKKERFSGDDDLIFTLPGDLNNVIGDYGEDGLLRGKRFTPEEDEIVKEAVFKYIAENYLGDEGLHMVLNSKKFNKLNGCWKEIGSAIPYRPYKAIYCRAQVLFRRSEQRKWTQEEYEQILEYQQKHGNQWSALAEELGKHRWHVKDTWRRIKLKDMKKGHWSQSEYQKFFDLVNNDLKLKVSEEKKSKHGMLRDNISWGAISDMLSTRSNSNCCRKWYKQLTSRMVAEGEWADTDDYRLVGALYDLDETCIEDVDWDDLIEHRSGEVCRKRWRQMVLHIGRHVNKSFAEQVEVMAKRYCPHILEAREVWDNKPRVP